MTAYRVMPKDRQVLAPAGRGCSVVRMGELEAPSGTGPSRCAPIEVSQPSLATPGGRSWTWERREGRWPTFPTSDC